MNASMIERINALARKAKTEGLTPAEKEEQQRLRQAYVAAFRGNLEQQLRSIRIETADGGTVPLKKKQK